MSDDLSSVFTPQAKTLLKVFGDADSYYRIPDFQRGYNWEAEHVEQFWDDITEALKAKSKVYFLGPMVLIKTPDGYDVIDGQQRLTTLMIFFCVLRDLNLGDKRILNGIKSLVDDRPRLRLVTQLQNQNQLEIEIMNGISFSDSTSNFRNSESNFLKTARIFKSKIELFPDEISILIDYILNNVVLITITCSDMPFAVKLFQGLNATGLPLSPADLIKSYLYGKCENSKSEQFIMTWREIEIQMKLTNDELSGLLSYYELFLLAKNPERGLYEELVKLFAEKDSNGIAYDIKKFAECYVNLYYREDKVLYSFWYLPNQVYWKTILLTALHSEYTHFNELCIEMRKLFYVYWIAGYTTSRVKQTSYNIIGWVKSKKPIQEIRVELATKYLEDKVEERFKSNIGDDAYGQSWLKPLLALLEYQLTDNSNPNRIELDNKLHVDHILPLEWEAKKEWQELWSKKEAESWLTRLGNLTLLSGKKNIAQGNNPPLAKAEMYNYGHGGKTAFEISKRVIKILENNQWNAEAVSLRQNEMIQQVEKLFSL